MYAAQVSRIVGNIKNADPVRERAWPIIIEPRNETSVTVQFVRTPGRLTHANEIPAKLEVLFSGHKRWKTLVRFPLTIGPDYVVYTPTG
jgi:hypothetical protein